MIEIVFGDSACGSLKLAQSFGGGPYREGCIGVIVSHSDGTNPTEAEIAQACREAEERERLAWENAVPIGGKTSDVYGFSLALSIGEIVDAPVGEKRRQTLERLFSIYPEEGQPDAGEILERVTESLQSVRDRAAAGEEIRICTVASRMKCVASTG